MSWGYVVGAAVVAGGTYLSSKNQADAAKKAANTQAQSASSAAAYQYAASQEALQFQREALQQAQKDFAPYLAAGTEGLRNLSTALPEYVQNSILPVAQRYGMYTPSALPSANYQINPVTGQMTSLAQQGMGGTQPVAYSPQDAAQPTYNPYASTPTDSGRVALQGGLEAPVGLNQLSSTSRSQREALRQQAEAKGYAFYNSPTELIQSGDLTGAGQADLLNDVVMKGVAPGDVSGMAIKPYGPGAAGMIYNPDYQSPQLPFGDVSQQAQTAMPTLATPEQLAQGGVLSPTVPTLQRDINYQFSTEDPVYQQKLSEKNAQIDKFLSKQGLQGSSAGESFRQQEINKLLAEEDARQYERAKTERDYGTQVAAQQYGLEAGRGDTLYNRMYGQANDLYNRQLAGALTYDEQQLGALGRQYSLAQDVYGTLYGGAQNMANYGLGAAGTTANAGINTGASMANTAMSTGQGLAQTALAAGNAQAQGQLAAGQAQAGMWQSLGYLGGNLASQYYGQQAGGGMNYSTPQYYGYASSPTSNYQSNISGMNYY